MDIKGRKTHFFIHVWLYVFSRKTDSFLTVSHPEAPLCQEIVLCWKLTSMMYAKVSNFSQHTCYRHHELIQIL
jgi:hypothetical protein